VEEFSTTKKSDGNALLSNILMTLGCKGCIRQDDISKSHLPVGICAEGNKTYLSYCSELIKYISESDDDVKTCIAKLADKNADGTNALVAAQSIAKKWEVKISSRKRTIIAFGGRVREYKQKIASAKHQVQKDQNQKFTAEMVQLVEPEELRRIEAEGAPGTPPGNMSITQFTRVKRKRRNSSDA
jgi:hypothetical protein